MSHLYIAYDNGIDAPDYLRNQGHRNYVWASPSEATPMSRPRAEIVLAEVNLEEARIVTEAERAEHIACEL